MQWMLPAADTYFAPHLAADPRGFQIDHLEKALSFCKGWSRAVDGGAHIGTWSKALAARFEQVMAFEPARDAFECMCWNTETAKNVVKFNLALGDHGDGFMQIGDDETRAGNTGARYLRHAENGKTQVVPLDPFGLQALDFLKLDLEGYELFALRGAKETLKRCRPVVMIEVKRFKPPRFGIDEHAASRYLVELGFREVAAIGRDKVFVHAD